MATTQSELTPTEKKFYEWTEEEGIVLHRNLALFHQGPLDRSVIATSEIHEGELLVSVSYGSYLVADMNDKFNDILNAYLKSKDMKFPPTTILVLRLLHEKSLGEKSRFYPYIQILPESFTNGDHFTDEQVELLQGTTLHPLLYSDIEAEKEKVTPFSLAITNLKNTYQNDIIGLVEGCSPLFGSKEITFEDYLWGQSIVKTRGFFSHDETGPHLLPLIDLFNHRSDTVSSPDTTSTTDIQQGPSTHPMLVGKSFELRAEKSISSGEEVFSNYGKLSNSQLLLVYGFVESETPYDTVYLSPATLITGLVQCGLNDEQITQRLEELISVHITEASGIIISRDDLLPDSFVNLIRLLCEEEDIEIEAGILEEISSLPPDDDEMLEIYQIVALIVQTKLKEYKRNLKEDLISLKDPLLPKALRDATIVASNEKKLLFDLLAQIKEEITSLTKPPSPKKKNKKRPPSSSSSSNKKKKNKN